MSKISLQDIIAREATAAVKMNIDNILQAIGRGDFSDFLLPAPQTPRDVRQDAKDRAKRTALQQLAIDLAVAVAIVMMPLVRDLDVTSKEQWMFIGLAILKTIVSVVISYFFRLFFAPKEDSQISLRQAEATVWRA